MDNEHRRPYRQRQTAPGDTADEQPHKRQKILACRRCRVRKQKCEDRRPCSNCAKSGGECLPTEPAPRPQIGSEYVRALEERVAELEGRDTTTRQHSGRGCATPRVDGFPTDTATSGLPAPRGTQGSGQSEYHNGRRTRPISLSVSPTDPTLQQPHHSRHSRHSQQSQRSNVSQKSQAQRSYSYPSPGGALSLGDDDDSDSGFDPIIYGLVMSPSVPDDSTLGRSSKSPRTAAHLHDGEFLPQTLIATMPLEVEDLLLEAYRGRAQVQYPFLHWDTFIGWHLEWKNCPPSELVSRSWQGYFVNLVYSSALLMLSLPRVGQSDARTFYKSGVSLLRHVLRRHDPVLQVQAYLLLSVHALHRSSTPRILSLASTTMRLCVQLQLHLAETEPEPVTPAVRFQNQIRRRCFWSAYCVDRLVMASFELPPSLPDAMISSKLYANIEDEDLETACARVPADTELPDAAVYTCVSPSLHILQCRRIQSEISNYTLRSDYKDQYEDSLEWRIRILDELESYKSRVQAFSDPHSKGHSSQRWLAMIYHYTLLLLYRPTKDNVVGPAGDWAIQASSQACLIFRKSQMDRQVAQAWLGILVQFQSGVTLLYCCWSTPPEYRTDSYDSPDVSDGLRACSNILAIMADRWPKADCLRDVFELLAREVPLVDRPSKPPTRISEASAKSIREKLPHVRSLIVRRSTVRMIEEMINEEFPRLRENCSSPPPPPRFVSRRVTPALEKQPLLPITGRLSSGAGTSMGSLNFELPFSAQQIYNGEIVVDGPQFSADELLAFPGIFDLDGWS